MKRPFGFALLLLFLTGFFPGHGLAQQPPGIDPEMMKRLQNPEAMQRMAAEAEAAQRCMAGIEQEKLNALKKRGEAASREIDQLCAAGKKDEALARAVALGKEMRSDPTIKKLRECTKGMSAMMQGTPWGQMPGVQDQPDPSDEDICS